MTLSTILSSIDGLPGCEAALKAALALGRRFEAHVELLHVQVPPESAIPMVGEGMTGAVIEEIMESAKQNAEQRAKEARRLFDLHCAEAGLPLAEAEAEPASGRFAVAWRQVTALEGDEVAARGRFADVIVLAAPDGATGSRFNDVLESAIFDSGRPVLVVPDEAPSELGHSVAVAWTDTREAARGVWAALPLLVKAERVSLFAVEEGDTTVDLEGLKRHLAYHGVAAELRHLEPDSRPVGEQLLDEAAAVEADLLVMGAYGHSRLRELVLGGVTRDVLERSKICTLMAH